MRRKHHAMEELIDGGRTITADDLPYELDVFRMGGAYFSEDDPVGDPNVTRYLPGREPTIREQYLRKGRRRFKAVA